MKRLNIISIIILSSVMFFAACEKETSSPSNLANYDDNQVKENSKIQKPINKANCEANCFFSSCTADCDAGQSANCACDWGSGECGCTGASVVVCPTQSSSQKGNLSDFKDFVGDNLTPSSVGSVIASDLEAIQTAIDNGDADTYSDAYNDYKYNIQNLSSENQNIINSYLINKGEDPWF